MSTVTLTLSVSPGTARRLATDDEARRRLEAMADAIFNEPEAYRLNAEQEAMIDEALDGVEAGHVRQFALRKYSPKPSFADTQKEI